MAIGDNVFNVRSNEGNGSSFILGENPALQHLVRQDEIQKQRDYEEQRMFANELAKVSTQSGKLLPNHKAEIDKQYADMIAEYAKTGGKFKVGSPQYVAMQSRLQKMKSDSALGEVYNTKYAKDMEDINQAEKAGKPYSQESITAHNNYLTGTALNEINPAQIPQLTRGFDLRDWQKGIESDIDKDAKSIKEGKPIPIGYGQVKIERSEVSDPTIYAQKVLQHPKASKAYMDMFTQMAKSAASDPTSNNPNFKVVNDVMNYAMTQNSAISKEYQNATPEQKAELLKPYAVQRLAEMDWADTHKDKPLGSEIRTIPQERESEKDVNPLKDLVKTTAPSSINLGKPEIKLAPDGMYRTKQEVNDNKDVNYVAVSDKKGKVLKATVQNGNKTDEYSGYKIINGRVYGTGKQTNQNILGTTTTDFVDQPIEGDNLTEVANQNHFSDKYGGVEGFKKWITSQNTGKITHGSGQKKIAGF